MEHPDFIVWMLCYPLVATASQYAAYKRERRYTDNVEGISAMLMTATWFGIGWVLY